MIAVFKYCQVADLLCQPLGLDTGITRLPCWVTHVRPLCRYLATRQKVTLGTVHENDNDQIRYQKCRINFGRRQWWVLELAAINCCSNEVFEYLLILFLCRCKFWV